MDKTVAVDAAKKSSGDHRYLIGVAVELSDLEEFRRHYCQTVREWYREWGIARTNEVIKSDHLSRNLPSYRLADARDELQRKILDTTSINRINICLCWHQARVDTPLNEMGGGKFINQFVKPYFPAVTLWQYHRSQRSYTPATEAMVDSFSGKITKSWKYVGNKFNISIIPKGDQTYPELSAADLISAALSNVLPDTTDPEECERIANGWILERLPDTDEQYAETRVLSEDSNNWVIEHLKPHKYDVRPHLHYPHPVFYVDEKVLSGKEREAIDRSQLFGYLCNVARDRGGCVTKLEPGSFPFTVRDGDYIVYNPVSPDRAQTLQSLHPQVSVSTVSALDVTSEFER